MIEGIGRCGRGLDCFVQVDRRFISVVEPRSWTAEMGSVTMNEPEHITLEGNRGIEVLGSDVHMMNVHAASGH